MNNSTRAVLGIGTLVLFFLVVTQISSLMPLAWFDARILPPAHDGLFLVKRVIDGDTILLENGEKVRYIGIDTPETVDPRKAVQCFGKEASAKNRELVGARRVRLLKDVSDRDRYGRLLRYVFVEDTFVNLELVRQGYAHASSYPPDVAHQDEFREAEREAREAKRGLWGECEE